MDVIANTDFSDDKELVVVPLNAIASSHMARRTFIGNIYKLVKDPNLVSVLTGQAEGS